MNILKLTTLILLLIFLVFLWILYRESFRQKKLFNSDSFKAKNYSNESIDLFTDIAFREGDKIRKWENNIYVELDSTSLKDTNCITLTDQVISVLTPLIKPIKICRVKTNGNIVIHANVENIPEGNYLGYTATNHFNLFSESIRKVDIYTLKNELHVLPHEMCHAIGLRHPTHKYPFYNIMGTNNYIIKEMYNNPSLIKPTKYDLVFDTFADRDRYIKQNIIPLQEREVIKMLYSEDIKVGLKKKYFLSKIK